MIFRDAESRAAGALVEHYAVVEQRIFGGIAGRLNRGMALPGWATARLAETQSVYRWVTGLLDGAVRQGDGIIGRLLGAAFGRGRQRAGARPVSTDVAMLSLDAQRLATRQRIAQANARAARYAVEVYQRATAAGISLSGTGQTELARRRSVQRALDSAARQGITGFVDAAGRSWNLAGYLEMAARTAAAQAALNGALSGLADQGRNLVIIHAGPQECARCRPWQDKILTIDDSGRGGGRVTPTPDVDRGARPGLATSVKVAGSLAEARAAGLYHPRCRCTVAPYTPGVTAQPAPHPDPEGSAARTRLRELERRVRELRLKAAVALDDSARKVAVAQIRAKQAEIRAHVEATAHLGIRRDTRRESLNLGLRV